MSSRQQELHLSIPTTKIDRRFDSTGIRTGLCAQKDNAVVGPVELLQSMWRKRFRYPAQSLGRVGHETEYHEDGQREPFQC